MTSNTGYIKNLIRIFYKFPSFFNAYKHINKQKMGQSKLNS
jgi:hypothetical protein